MSAVEPQLAGTAARLALALLLTILATATGLFWAGQRAERDVDATASLRLRGEVQTDGALAVREELVVAEHGGTATRVLADPSGVRWVGAFGDDGEPVPHTTVEVTDGLAVTVPLDDSAAVLDLRYTLLGATVVGQDAVEFSWEVVDDRNPLALGGLQVSVAWTGSEPAEVLGVDAPGANPTVVTGPGEITVSLGELPAHHDVAIHSALPLSAVPEGMAQDRSVMEEMGSMSAGTPAAVTGGGPLWLAVGVASAAVVAWVLIHRRHGREPEVPPPGSVTEPPSEHPPAEIGWLLRHGAEDDLDLSATLVDLAARGTVVLDEDGRWRRRGGDPDQTAMLHAHEAVLLGWLFDEGPELDPAMADRRVRSDPQSWRAARRTFVTAVEEESRQDGLIVRSVADEAVLGAGLAAAALVVGGVIGVALGQPAWVSSIAVGSLAVVHSGELTSLSPAGAQLASRWQAYTTWVAGDPARAHVRPGHAVVLGVEDRGDHRAAAAVTLVSAVQEAFVESTSYVAGPRRRPRRRR